MMGKKLFKIAAVLCSSFSFCSFCYAASHSQSLSYIVRHTLQQNPNVLESQARLSAAQAATDVARGGYFPRIDARAAAGSGIYNTPYYEEHNAKLDETEGGLYVVQPIFSGLSTYNLVKQRRANAKSAGYNEGYTENRLALAAIQVYLEVLRSYSLKILALDNVKIHKRALRRVSLRYQGGGGHKTDVDLARGRTARTQSTLHTVEAIHQNARAAFLQVVGLESQKLKIPALPKVPRTIAAAKKITLTQHPALLAAKETANAAAAAVNVNKGRFLPTIDIEASANSTHNTNGFPGRNKDFRALVVAKYNFLNGGSDRAAIAQARQLYIAAIQNYQDIRRRVIENTTRSWNELMADRKKLRELYTHVRASRDVLLGYKKQFAMGRRTLLDVLNTENELFNSRVQLLNGKYAVQEDRYVLLADMGILAQKFTT